MEPKEWRKQFKTKRLKAIGNDPLMAVSYHEAGHSLIHLLYGIMPGPVTIIPDEEEGSAGSASPAWAENVMYHEDDAFLLLEKDIDATPESLLEYQVLSLLGGIIGGAFYSGKYCFYTAHSDLENIGDRLLHFGICEITNLQPYWDRTFTVIKDNFQTLEIIANNLYKEKTLNEGYFEQLYKTLPDECKISFDIWHD